MLLINNMFNKTRRSIIISTVDFQTGYNQILNFEETKFITAFSAGNGLYEYNLMLFGLKGTRSTFQRAMNLMLIYVHYVMVYIDDIVIFSGSF